MASLDDLINKYSNIDKEIDNAIIESLKETGDKIVDTAKASTPVKTGALRRSIHRTDVTKENNNYSMYITTENMGVEDYASKIENGFTGSKGGHYQGKHMVGNAIDIEMNNINSTIEKKLGDIFND